MVAHALVAILAAIVILLHKMAATVKTIVVLADARVSAVFVVVMADSIHVADTVSEVTAKVDFAHAFHVVATKIKSIFK